MIVVCITIFKSSISVRWPPQEEMIRISIFFFYYTFECRWYVLKI